MKNLDLNKYLYFAFLLIMLSLTLVILAGPELILVRQISEYTVHIMLGFFALGFIFLFFTKPMLMYISFASCAALCVFIKNQSNPDLLYPKDNKTEKFITSHINLSNVIDAEALVKELSSNKVDFVSFQEFTPDWQGVLSKYLAKDYPFSKEYMRIDLYGKAVYSKHPIEDIDTINKNLTFDIACKVRKQNQIYAIISPYLTPALDKNSLNIAKGQMKSISNYINTHNHRAIVLGEFNMVFWSDEIRTFRDACKLNNTRKDVIRANMKVPYDHIFYTRDLQCLNVRDFILNNDERVGLISHFQQLLIPDNKPFSVRN